MIRSARRPPLSHQCPPVIKTTICFLKALLNVRLTRFVRKCTTISSPHGPEIWSGFKNVEEEEEGGEGEGGFFFFRAMHIQMRGLNCLSYWRIVLRERWEVACVFPLKADFWTAGAGAGGCFASISLGPRPLLPLLMRLWQHSKSGPAVITGAHATPPPQKHNNTF